ncbi:hypothetical protein EDD11_000145 [Mortierella claussenii]|nr:hypothetical protein EDD11_000145 [Mortierella claussenii]
MFEPWQAPRQTGGKQQEHAQRLQNADIIVARMGALDIAGTNNNFGPILSQVINLPRYEPPPSNFQNDIELILDIGRVEELLIDCYFSFFNYYIPVLSRKTFMDQIKNPLELKTVAVQKLLACVLATGFAFRQEIGVPDMINKMEPNYGESMRRKFHHFNTQEVLNSSIETCQCYLILTGFYSSIANYDAVHNLVALAHSMAAGQGLNRNKGFFYQIPYKGEDHTVDSVEMGHRIFWSVVIVCAGYSLSHQSPFITSNDYDIPFPKRLLSDKCEDFQGVMQDDFEGIEDLVHFAPMYEITSRVADITCTATRQRPHTKVDEVRKMLEEWRETTLPERLRITPTDMAAIQRQSRFSKFYHAMGYMFEICLHHTFQLHESHRALGVHGVWSGYCFDAAVGIKNIYRTRPMTRMNAHVILPVAAGAFANIVASKLLGKEESAQQHCDDIKVMLSEIVRSSSSVERSRLVGSFAHAYGGVTKLTEGEVPPFQIMTPQSPPWNERSPSQTTTSSPAQTTDVTGDTDAYSSDGEDDDDDDDDADEDKDQMSEQEDVQDGSKRMSGHFGFDKNQQELMHQQQQQQQQQQQVQHRPHPSVTNRTPSNTSLFSGSQQQQHPVIETNYSVEGYSEMMPSSVQSPVSAGSYHSVVSSGFSISPYGGAPNHDDIGGEEFSSYPNRPHLQQRALSSSTAHVAGPFSSNGAKTTADSGFASISSSHGQYASENTYFVQHHHHHQQQQQEQQQQQGSGRHQSFSSTAQQSMNNVDDGDDHSRRHQNSIRSTTNSATTPGFAAPATASNINNNQGPISFTNNHEMSMDSSAEDTTLLNDLARQGLWQHQLNEAQLTKIAEAQAIMNNGKLSPQELHNFVIKVQQQVIALGSAPPSHSLSTAGSYGQGSQYLLHQQQQQRQQHQHPHSQQHQQHHHHQQQQSSTNYSGTDTSVPMSLNGSQLLSGGFDTASSMSGITSDSITSLGLTPEDFAQDPHQRFYHHQQSSFVTSVPSTTTATSRSFSDGSDLSSPVSPTHHHHHQQQHPMSMPNQGVHPGLDNMMPYSSQHHQSTQHMLNMSSFSPERLDYATEELLAYSSLLGQNGFVGVLPGMHDIVGAGELDSSAFGLGGSSSELEQAVLGLNTIGADIVLGGRGDGGLGGAEDADNHDLTDLVKMQMFSSVASKSLLSQTPQQHAQQHTQQAQQTQQQRPLSYHQHQAR